MGFKIIGRKNGKKTVSDNSEKDVTKVTKVLEFLTEAEPRAPDVGSMVRFMWNPGTGTSLCWFKEKSQKELTLTRKRGKKNGRLTEWQL